MDRRNFLSALGAAGAGAFFAGNGFGGIDLSGGGNFGWLDMPHEVRKFERSLDRPYLSQQNDQIRGSGKGYRVNLILALEKVMGTPFVPRSQKLGDCVGQATALAVDILNACQILAGGNFRFENTVSSEYTYAHSRVEIGGGVIRGSGGSTGSWAARSILTGVLTRDKYDGIDLLRYRPDLADYWGRSGVGVPDHLETIAAKYPVKTVARVTSWDQAIDCLKNSTPINVCSSVGFHTRADSDGFLNPSARPWHHSMAVVGYDDVSERRAGLICNSWGSDWYGGPEHKLGTPRGCFWVDAKVLDYMLKSGGDSWAYSHYQGFKRRVIDFTLI